jgi:glycosyltransferase involved in cell wall biosynthesis
MLVLAPRPLAGAASALDAPACLPAASDLPFAPPESLDAQERGGAGDACADLRGVRPAHPCPCRRASIHHIMKVSVVLRTFNEQKHLRALLEGIGSQAGPGLEVETILVDSGSDDDTLRIAAEFPVRVVPIRKSEFTFGRSLNMGCAAATGDVLVFVSGHCIPANAHWIAELIAPLDRDGIVYTYGGQVGDDTSHFSERQIFAKYFPAQDKLPQEGFFCNNANAALLTRVWRETPFDEELTGLEDMHLAKRLVAEGHRIGYVASAAVYHLHSETWAQVQRRFEREAIALQHIMPEVHLRWRDISRYFISAMLLDFIAARQQKLLGRYLIDIVRYRFHQFRGSFLGNHTHRTLSNQKRESYFYPR